MGLISTLLHLSVFSPASLLPPTYRVATLSSIVDMGSVIEFAAGAGVTLGGIALCTKAALQPESQLFGRTLIAGTDPNEMALTYDDGPNDAATMELIELLDRYNAKATFFMIGRFVRQRPEIVRAVHAAGHIVGNHTMNHPWLTNKPAKLIRSELKECNEALEDALGCAIKYFRPPHGARRPVVLRAARELGLVPVQWNVMGFDWEPIGTDKIVEHIENDLARVRKEGRGANILLHDGFDKAMGTDRHDTHVATERLLERFKREGTRTVTVEAWG